MLLFVPSRGAGQSPPPSSFPLSSTLPRRHLNILVLSEEVHREEQKEVHSECNTFYKWDPLLSIAHSTCAVSCLFIHSPPSQVFMLDSSTSSSAMQNKTIPQWVVSADGGVLATVGVGADAIARCGAQEALACVTELWGPCRTSRNALIGCPQSRGCPIGDASEILSGRSRGFLPAPGILEREEDVSICR